MAWPTRAELINYTAVVLTTLVLMIALIFVLNLAFGKFISLALPEVITPRPAYRPCPDDPDRTRRP